MKKKTVMMARYSYFLFVYFENATKYTATLSNSYTSYERYFLLSVTRPTQVGDMDRWSVTWLDLSDLIGWGEQMSSTSW